MYLSHKLSHNISAMMYENGTIKKNDIAIYEYCYDYLLEQVIYTAAVLLISLPLQCFFSTLLHICIFSYFRGYCGGYHAGTEKICAVISNLLSAFVLLALPKLPAIPCIVCLPLYILSMVCTLVLTPVGNRNKQFTEPQKIKSRKAGLLGTMTVTVLFVVFSMNHLDLYCNTVVLCSVVIACGMIAGQISWRRYMK